MPVIYKNKRTGKRTGTGKYKGHKYGKKASVRANTNRINRNAKAITLLNETQFRKCSYIEHMTHGPWIDGHTGSGVIPIYTKPLIVPNQWLPIFGSQPLLDPQRQVQKVVHPDNFLLSGFNLRVNLRLQGAHLGNNTLPIHYHYMIFSIKRDAREQVKWRTSGTTGISNSLLQNLKKGIDYEDFDMGYTVPGVNAQWRLNRDLYTVHASRKGTIGVWPAPYPLASSGSQAQNYKFVTTGSMKDANRDLNLNVKWKRKLKFTGYSQSLDPNDSPIRNSWKTMNVEQVADSDQVYRVLFHNANHVEQSPLVISESIEFFGHEPQ